MKPKERAIAALSLREPEGILPAFELEFQLVEKLIGKSFLSGSAFESVSKLENYLAMMEARKDFGI